MRRTALAVYMGGPPGPWKKFNTRRQGMARKKSTTSKDRTGQQLRTGKCGEDFNSTDADESVLRSQNALVRMARSRHHDPERDLAVDGQSSCGSSLHTHHVDGVHPAGGRLDLGTRRQILFPRMTNSNGPAALFSVLIWVMFEMFNLSAWAWSYSNRPTDRLVEGLVFAWAFATIIPALLRTRSLFSTFSFFDRSHPWKNFKFTPFWQAVSFVAGLAPHIHSSDVRWLHPADHGSLHSEYLRLDGVARFYLHDRTD